jgi:hypothetical protein
VKSATANDYETVVKKAQEAFIPWRTTPAPKRGEIVRQLAERIRFYKEPLGQLVSYEMGKSLQEGLGEVQEMIDICDFAVGLSRQLYGLTMHSERPGHRMYEQYHPLGIVGIISITNSGSGYVIPPTITFTGISSVSAAATAVVSTAGSITEIRITNAGLRYATIPTIIIGSPTINSTGSFIFNEIVTGSQSDVTARVRSWNSITNILEVSQVNGQFISGENIVGTSSSASYYLRKIDVFAVKDGFANNEEIEDAAEDVIDFSERNPFGMP